MKMSSSYHAALFIYTLSFVNAFGASLKGKDSPGIQHFTPQSSTTTGYHQKQYNTPPPTSWYPENESSTYSTICTNHPESAVRPDYAYNNCPNISNGDIYTQAQFLDRMTHICRYDRLTRPGGNVKGSTYGNQKNPPVDVFMLIDIRHIEAADQLQFRMHMLLQYRYRDPRLDYHKESPKRSLIVGEDALRQKIWVPHVILENEKDSSTMGSDSRDIYLAIDPHGVVTYARRIKTTLYCWMDLQKFPFDEQICELNMLSWTYNTDQMMLRWESVEPVVVAEQLHLTEYTFLNYWTESYIKPAYRQAKGAFPGNYSSLVFKYRIVREIGFYILDYFIPSIMLVCISWVSFWLQADASAPRITIGTSTMLSFITLASSQSRTLPKVSYIKASEIWFLGCTIFIFGSMVEFAFVNIIWRRKANVELKKVNSKYILKSTLTPRLHRKELLKNTGRLQKSHSCSSLYSTDTKCSKTPQYNSYLTVHSYSGDMSMPRITTESVDDLASPEKCCDNVHVNVSGNGNAGSPLGGWTTMTPQEIAAWIDRRSRLVFPCAFIVFNAFYWGFVYWL